MTSEDSPDSIKTIVNNGQELMRSANPEPIIEFAKAYLKCGPDYRAHLNMDELFLSFARIKNVPDHYVKNALIMWCRL